MTGDLLVYGAYGYTGRLISAAAADRGLDLTVAGRDRPRVESLAGRLQCDERVFGLDEGKVAEQVASEHDVVLHCAGPFVDTSRPMVEACLAAGTHYLDITGEIDVFEAIHGEDDRARERGTMLMPGVGFDVVPTDCLAAHLAGRLADPVQLELAIEAPGDASAGTLRTALRQLPDGGRVRRNGEIVRVPLAHRTREVDFGDGPRTAAAIPWGDVSTAYYTTGIPSVTVFQSMPPSSVRALKAARYLAPLLGLGPVRRGLLRLLAARHGGPDAAERRQGEARIWGQATNAAGDRAVARLRTPSTYALTIEAALGAVEHVLDGDAEPGFQTPGGCFGPDFVLEIDGVEREDIDEGGPDDVPEEEREDSDAEEGSDVA